MYTPKSFLKGQWTQGSGDGIDLVNPTTGETIGHAFDGGLDLLGAMAWGREHGGRALRQMTFAERGALLKGWSRVIHNARDELLDLACVDSGNTRSDGKFDVDGAAGTLSYYAYLGKTLGDERILADGEAEPLTRSSARMVGRHWYVPRRGVAVHINAFNFPAWGLAEKAASAILAGVPVFVKPAVEASLVAARIVELWHEADLIPDGALQLYIGEPRDLLDHLQAQDVVAFTGSGETGRVVRTHPRVLELGIPVNVEADSVNAAVLGPDVQAGSDTFFMAIGDIVRDMTQKAGQKCTAIRRIVAPEDLVEPLVEMLGERLADAAIGDPADKVHRVGPLATAAQQRDINAGITALAAAHERVWGDPDACPNAGFFVAPQLFVARGGVDAALVHEREVFGPVASILPYSGDAQEAVDIVAKGGGGLVCSVYSDDRGWSADAIPGLMPWHGRVVWGSKKVANQGVGPGTVLPSFVHGGPGAAGGGEELGGLRGLRLYWQRTALQGDRGLIDKIMS